MHFGDWFENLKSFENIFRISYFRIITFSASQNIYFSFPQVIPNEIVRYKLNRIKTQLTSLANNVSIPEVSK